MIKAHPYTARFLAAALCLLVLAAPATTRAQPGTIRAVAGTGGEDFTGDGSHATNAQLDHPEGLAFDADGNLYVSDTHNHRIRRIDADGNIATVAGTGPWGYFRVGNTFFGDGFPAGNAGLQGPIGLTFDADGNLFFVDSRHHRVRKIAPDGIITTVAGNGERGFAGDGGPALQARLSSPRKVAIDAAGNLFIADTGNNCVRKVDGDGIITTVAGSADGGFAGDGGSAVEAILSSPEDICIDGNDDLFIADTGNNRVRKVASDGTITTVAGTGTAGLAGDGGLATQAELNHPLGLLVDAAGDLFVADARNSRIRKIASDGLIATIAGSVKGRGSYGDGGPATRAGLTWPNKLAVDAGGNLFFTDGGAHLVRMVEQAAAPTRNSSGRVSFAAPAALARAFPAYGDVNVDPNDLQQRSISLTFDQPIDIGTARIAVATQDGQDLRWSAEVWDDISIRLFPRRADALAAAAGTTYRIRALGVKNERGDVTPPIELYFATSGPPRDPVFGVDLRPGGIATIAGTGQDGFSGDDGPALRAQLNNPQGLFVDAAGNLLIADTWNHRIRKVTPDGDISTLVGDAGNGFDGDGGVLTQARISYPTSLFIDDAGNLVFVDTGNHRIRKVDSDGIVTTVAGNGRASFTGDGGPAVSAALDNPHSPFSDAAGNIYFADTGNHRIRKVDAQGVISTVAGNGDPSFSGDGRPAVSAALNQPKGLFVDSEKNLYFADSANHRIRKVAPDGTISTIAGSGTAGFSGDGGPAILARIDQPQSLFIDAAGQLFFADANNRRIRKVAPDGTISTVVGNGTAEFYGEKSPATAAQLTVGLGLTVDSLGNLIFADSQHDRVRALGGVAAPTRLNAGMAPALPDSTPPRLLRSVPAAGAVDVDPDRLNDGHIQLVFVAPVDTDRVAITLQTQGGRTLNWGITRLNENTLTLAPRSAAAERIAPGTTYRIRILGKHARHININAIDQYFTTKSTSPPATGLSDAVTERRPGFISTISGNRRYHFSGDTGPARDANMYIPYFPFIDAEGSIFFADHNNDRVRMISAEGVINTVAGSSKEGYSGDGGPAIDARLDGPLGVFVDGAGNLYINDGWNHCVRKVAPDGTISTVAGNGERGFAGDGGPAVAARFVFPSGLFVDAAGRVFISDTFNHRVRMIDADGIITTVAGNGGQGYGGDGGPAVAARLHNPHGLFIDPSGNLLIADAGNHRVRKVAPDGTISTVAGVGGLGFAGDGGPANLAKLASPFDVFVDAAGSLYIAERVNHRIRKVTPDGIISTVAGNGDKSLSGDGGPAARAALDSPGGLFGDAHGNMVFADTGNDRLRAVSSVAAPTRVGAGAFAYNRPPYVIEAFPPYGGTFEVDHDAVNERFISLVLSEPVDASQMQYSLQTHTGRSLDWIARLSGDKTIILSPAEPNGDPIVPGHTYTVRIEGIKDRKGAFATFVLSFKTPLQYPEAQPSVFGADLPVGHIETIANGGRVLFGDATGALFLGEFNQISKISPAGTRTPISEDEWGLGNISDLFIDRRGNLFIADQRNHRISKVSPDGTVAPVAGSGTQGFSGDGGPAAQAQLDSPGGLYIDADGTVFFADTKNHRIRKIATDGIITTVAGTGVRGFAGDGGPAIEAQLDNPGAIAFDASGNLLVADEGNLRIRSVAPDGTISTIAGNGQYIYAEGVSNNFGESIFPDGIFPGDGKPAADAILGQPQSLFVDAVGNIYVGVSERIRKIAPDGIITTVAGIGPVGGTNVESPSYFGDGGPALAAGLFFARDIFVDDAGDLFFTDHRRVRIVRGIAAPNDLNPGAFTRIADSTPPSLTRSTPADGAIDIDADRVNQVGIALDFSEPIDIDSAAVALTDQEGKSLAWTARILHDTTLVLSPAAPDFAPIAHGSVYRVQVTDVRDKLGYGDTVEINFATLPENDSGTRLRSGFITTVAGNGERGRTGDGGPAVAARLESPVGVLSAPDGALFIGDLGNNSVRRVTADGVISTFIDARLGGSDFSLDTEGNLYVSETFQHRLYKVTPDGQITRIAGGRGLRDIDGKLATDVQLRNPIGHARDADGNMYLAEWGTHRVLKISANGIISIYAGSGEKGYSGDGGPASLAKIDQPHGIAVDGAGNLFFTDSGNNRIRKVSTEGIISTIAGTGKKGVTGDGGPALSAKMDRPQALGLDAAGTLFVSEQHNHRIRKITRDGIISTIAGNGVEGHSGDGGPAVWASINHAGDLYIDHRGDLYFSDVNNYRVRMVAGVAAPTDINTDIAQPAPAPPAQDEQPEELPVQPGMLTFDLQPETGDQGLDSLAVSRPGQTLVVQIHIHDAPAITGWSAEIEYDGDKLRYIEGSFRTGTFITGLSGLAQERDGRLSLNGESEGGDHRNSGDGELAVLAFETLPGFAGPATLAISTINLHLADGTTARLRVSATANLVPAGPADSETMLVEQAQLPILTGLAQNYPNPFNAGTTLPYQLARSSRVRLELYNLNGQLVRTLVDAPHQAGFYEIIWDGLNAEGQPASGGLYFARLRTDLRVQTRKIILLR